MEQHKYRINTDKHHALSGNQTHDSSVGAGEDIFISLE
jgi:hypothetical protein